MTLFKCIKLSLRSGLSLTRQLLILDLLETSGKVVHSHALGGRVSTDPHGMAAHPSSAHFTCGCSPCKLRARPQQSTKATQATQLCQVSHTTSSWQARLSLLSAILKIPRMHRVKLKETYPLDGIYKLFSPASLTYGLEDWPPNCFKRSS